jgi:hypothetical protein
MAPMSSARLFLLAGALAIGGVVCLLLGMSVADKDIRSHLADQYTEYSRDGDGVRYDCTGSPQSVADQIADYAELEARASDRGTEYLRYEDDIVTVGPDGSRPCSVRVEDLGARYSGGGFIFLGPGFYPGAPSGGAGGSPGGPDGGK